MVFVKCKHCGLRRQEPQPEKSAILKRYDKTYLEYEIKNHYNYRDIALKSLSEAGLKPRDNVSPKGEPRSILEIGCATGAMLSVFKEAGWKSFGVEVSPEMAEYARENFKLDIFTGIIEEAPLLYKSFDVIIATHLIEHLNYPVTFLESVKKLLLPESSFYLITPNLNSLQAFIYKQNWRSAIRDHLFLFSKATLISMLKKLGFKIEYYGSWGGWPMGMKPKFLKKPLDKIAKRYGFGDVMIVKASLF